MLYSQMKYTRIILEWWNNEKYYLNMYFNIKVIQCVLNAIFVTWYLVYGSLHICENYKYHTLYVANQR
jgi:hypothetical protein